MRRTIFPALVLAAISTACVRPPRPTAAMLALERHSRARVEGRIIDTRGHPVAGLTVQAVPRGKDIPWSPGATTDSEGRFRLSLVAPASYVFVLTQGDRTVVTDDPRDPSRVVLEVQPGEHRRGIELIFLIEECKRILEASGYNL